MAKENDRILVLCVDRDNDIGEKTKHSGPIIGREKIIKAAADFGVADPEDSDVNAMFECVRVYDEMKKTHTTHAVVLTGDKDVGIKSDREVAKQLDRVIKDFKPTELIMVSDGSEDEHVRPIIESRVPISSVKRVIVKQDERLESTYYKIKDFFEVSLESPKFAGLVFGLPAIILILLGIFGAEGGRIVLFVLGAFLVIKWFRLEKHISGVGDELKTSLTRQRFAFFVYTLAIIVGALSVYRGYVFMSDYLNSGFFEITSSFISGSVYFIWIAITVAWFGRVISVKKMRYGKIAAIPIFVFAISLLIFNAGELVLKQDYPITNFILSIVIGFALIVTAVYLERK